MSPTAQATPAASTSACFDVKAIASLLSCSQRHVYRMAETGLMPAPIRLGGLMRWNRRVVMEWFETGCPPVRKPEAPAAEGGAN